VSFSVPFGGLWSSPSLKTSKRRRRPLEGASSLTLRTQADTTGEGRGGHKLSVHPTSRLDERWVAPKLLPREPLPTQVVLRRSEKWFPKGTTKVASRGIPYIDKGGHITGSSKVIWKCSSAQWIATVARSIFDVIKKRMKHGSHRKSKKSIDDFAMRVAIYYSLTQNDSRLERLVRCHHKSSVSLLFKFVCEMDDQTRFSYGQMQTSILWLQSRGYPRAKSISKCYIPAYRNFGLRSYDTTRDISVYLNWLCDPWIAGPLRYKKS